MKHLPFNATPLTFMAKTSSKLQCNIYCKRDDLIERDGGGSKARMLQYILADVTPLTHDVVLTAGGPCSNFNRACAMACARLSIPMHLVVYTENEAEFNTSLNYKICNAYRVKTTYCKKKNVAQTIQEVRETYEAQGLRVKLIYGGGKSLEGSYAYYEAVKELNEQLSNIDHIFVACGTGTTLAGIGIGATRWFPAAKIHGISIARTWNQEKDILLENMQKLRTYLRMPNIKEHDIFFQNIKYYEQFMYGGYAKSSSALNSDIMECIRNEGMLVDPIYVGKSWHGMLNIIKENHSLFKGTKIVFWNTGGVYTLLSLLSSINE